ncbi:hypothetical protein BU23DRAFT_652880 [Bimuria novae-zelandiae CBS 107.79]|uniref:DUF829-domain-containing protein n=1 Tax=Bimuria novae-zelandiae CBS 107.79 TaxID=1447943 RepID=A0A6A5V046_9PLEO|nr:hypothetical protein BU23DRAFT_652880 [Bimuria novae-zelandiae CBS 107.79]
MSHAPLEPVTTPNPLSFMNKLGPLVSFYQPPEASSTRADHQPRLIIVASWTDAKDTRIAKYTTKYRAMYPAAQILLLRNTMSCQFRPSQIGPAMKVATHVVRAAFQTAVSSSSPPLLIHIFSNGGSSSVANLYEQFATTAGHNEDKRLPPHATVFDSSPGIYQITRAVAYMNVGLPYFQQLMAAPFWYAFAVFWSAGMALRFLPNSLEHWYKSHNEHVGNAAEVRRVYIYSADDAIIDHKVIEAHASEAKRKGFSVALERYEGSAHVAHLRKDEDRYWGIVRRAMETYRLER